MYADFVKALVGGLAGLLCTLIAFVATSIRDTASKRRRDIALENISKHVAFCDLALKALQQTNGPDLEVAKATIHTELKAALDAYLKLSVPYSQLMPAEGYIAPHSLFRKILLLYRPKAVRAWLPRVFFYLSAGYLSAVICAAALFLVNHHIRVTQFGPIVLTIFVIIFFVLLFRQISIRLEQSQTG